MTWLAVAVLALYLVPVGVLWFAQDAMIFPAPAVERAALDAAAAVAGARPVDLVAADGTRIYAWHLPARGERAVIFFHGNAETVPGRSDLHALLREAGFDVVVPAYRGYPGSEGRPSERGIAMDARAAWDFVTGELGIADVVLHGKSLGGGVAAALAAEVPARALVLESTFTSVAAMASASFPVFPVRLLLRHPFDTLGRAGSLDLPILVLHGAADEVIPVAHGRRLAAALAATYVEVPGEGHQTSLPVVDPTARAAYLGLLTR